MFGEELTCLGLDSQIHHPQVEEAGKSRPGDAGLLSDQSQQGYGNLVAHYRIKVHLLQGV